MEERPFDVGLLKSNVKAVLLWDLIVHLMASLTAGEGVAPGRLVGLVGWFTVAVGHECEGRRED
jgi:hypothetical protein